LDNKTLDYHDNKAVFNIGLVSRKSLINLLL
jgi:hypothetical protein